MLPAILLVVLADPRIQQAKQLGDQVDKLYAAGQYAQALGPAQRSLALYEAALGRSAPEVAVALQDLAEIERALGAYERAVPYGQRAVAIREQLGDPAKLADALSFLAPVYYSMGAYERAEPLFRRALELHEKARGVQSPQVSTCLSNLAVLYKQMGDYEHAEPLLSRTLAIDEATRKPDDPKLAITLNNLAELYDAMGQHERAIPLLERSLAIREKAHGPNHPAVAVALSNLGLSLKSRGEYARAEPLLVRALAIDEQAFGAVHPSVAASCNALATLYVGMKRPQRAEPLFRRALTINETALPPNHPDLAKALRNLAAFLVGQGRVPEAVALWDRELAISQHLLRSARMVATESRMAAFLAALRTQEQAVYTLAAERPTDAKVRRLALATALLRKGRSIDEAADSARTVRQGLGPKDQERFAELRALRSKLATLALAGPGKLPKDEYGAKLAALEQQAEQIEQDLAQRSAPLRALRGESGPDDVIDRVARALPAESALVEVVAFRRYRFAEPLPARRWGELSYLALVLRPDGTIGAANLGAAGPIDAAVARLLGALQKPDAAAEPPARSLEKLVLAKVRPLAVGRQNLLLSLDGQLLLVPFAALSDGQGWLIDRYSFAYVTSGRDLLREDAAGANTMVVLADPAFGSAPTGASAPTALATARRDRGLQVGEVRPLPGTRKEAEALRALLPSARLLVGAAASEPALLSVQAPGILHVATHGLFVGDAAPEPASGRGLKLARDGSEPSAPANPLLRSALVLAGAQALGHDPPDATAADKPDGLATALEMAGMNLHGTQLVVLSACDSGRGDVRLGQGVYGLRRAVLIAGAQTLVTSLWRVDDEVTRELMVRFYEQLLAGRGRAESMRAAALAVRAQHAHPYYWAPFVVIGRAAALSGFAPGR